MLHAVALCCTCVVFPCMQLLYCGCLGKMLPRRAIACDKAPRHAHLNNCRHVSITHVHVCRFPVHAANTVRMPRRDVARCGSLLHVCRFPVHAAITVRRPLKVVACRGCVVFPCLQLLRCTCLGALSHAMGYPVHGARA